MQPIGLITGSRDFPRRSDGCRHGRRYGMATAVDSLSSRAQARASRLCEGRLMSLGTIIVVLLILMLIGAIPTWPHSASWGYFPSGALGTVLIIVLVLALLGRI